MTPAAGTGLQQQDWRPRTRLRRAEAAARHHHAQRDARLDRRDACTEFPEIGRDQWLYVSVGGDRRRTLELLDLTREIGGERDREAGQRGLQPGLDLLLVVGVDGRAQQRDRDGLDVEPAQFLDRAVELLLAERRQHLTAGIEPLSDLDTVLRLDQRLRQFDVEIIDVVAPLTADIERIAHAAGGDERGLRPPCARSACW